MPLREDRLVLSAKRRVDQRIDFEPVVPMWVEYPELGVRVRLYEVEDGRRVFRLAAFLKKLMGETSAHDEHAGVGLALRQLGVVEITEHEDKEGAD